MVKVDLITGFLGAGKTTFIKKYVKHLVEKGEQIAILENDYGAINVDMLMLKELHGPCCELEMVSGGCDIDCYRRRFKTKLISMAMRGYTRVVIEPSGIFDVTDFYDVVREEPLDNWYEIGNVFCVVDAKLELPLSDEADYIFSSQILNSGCIIFSRTQETDVVRLGKTIEYISKLCKPYPVPSYITANWNELSESDLNKIDKAGYKVTDIAKKYNIDDIDFNSLYYLETGMNIKQLEDNIKTIFEQPAEVVGSVFRIKGFVKNESENKWYEINATKHEINISELDVGQEVFIVIGENLNKLAINELIGCESAV